MRAFSKPSRKPPEEPAGLDAFAARVPGAVLALVDSAVARPATSPEERELLGMNVRFTAAEKAALLRLSAHQKRSQHQVIKLLLGPLLLAEAAKLDP